MKELYLSEVVKRVVSRWKLVLIVTCSFVGIGIIYLLSQKPTFRAEIHLLPPVETTVSRVYPWLSESDLMLNASTDPETVTYKAWEVYEFAVRNLRSDRYQWEFFQENAHANELSSEFPGVSAFSAIVQSKRSVG